ncbi:MAG TPA: hypothetical protein VJ714_00755 [Anaerolineae bacterium]|nr:hypothetical protein [Anaerolineae bacterium]
MTSVPVLTEVVPSSCALAATDHSQAEAASWTIIEGKAKSLDGSTGKERRHANLPVVRQGPAIEVAGYVGRFQSSITTRDGAFVTDRRPGVGHPFVFSNPCRCSPAVLD